MLCILKINIHIFKIVKFVLCALLVSLKKLDNLMISLH